MVVKFMGIGKSCPSTLANTPVVSTPIKDVINPYGIKNLVHIGSTATDFIRGIERELKESKNKKWISDVDKFLKEISWDKTHSEMIRHMQMTLKNINTISVAS